MIGNICHEYLTEYTKTRVRLVELFMHIKPSLSDRFFFKSWKRNVLFFKVHTLFSVFKKRERKTTKKQIRCYTHADRKPYEQGHVISNNLTF